MAFRQKQPGKFTTVGNADLRSLQNKTVPCVAITYQLCYYFFMDKLQKIVSLCKRRGFVFPGSEIYNGLANTWDYGPLGVELVNNIKNFWWERFVRSREDVVGLQSGIIMNSKVWQTSGHLKKFTDPLVECEKCKKRFRQDQVKDKCPDCSGILTAPKQFNLMFKTFIGPIEDKSSEVYLRPETAQGMFVDYKLVKDSMRLQIPFGIAQIGKAFRNEITPGNFIFRVLEFEQMEIEYFCEEKDWLKYFDYWQKQMAQWLKNIGLKNYKIREHNQDELSHYSKKTIDFEYKFPFGQKELYGLAYRTNFDLKAHGFQNPAHVIEPTFGVERTFLVLLCEAYCEEDKRIVLKLDKKLAPYKAAVFPLLANKPKLIKKAREIFDSLKKKMSIAWDDRGNIGKRYYSQDEIGTPHCLTIDFQTLEDDTLTIRDRDTTKQRRIKINALTQEFE